jgi:hypothetical protein
VTEPVLYPTRTRAPIGEAHKKNPLIWALLMVFSLIWALLMKKNINMRFINGFFH